MKLPVWFKKSAGGYFYVPVHWAGWLCYLISFADVVAAFYMLGGNSNSPTEQLKAAAPVLILNFALLAVVIFLTCERPKEEN
jgi:hypothetical protein